MKWATFPAILGVSIALVTQCGYAETYQDGSSFTIRHDYSHENIYEVYEQLHRTDRPQFITADLALHTGGLLFDYSLRAVEIERLYGVAAKLSRAMATEAERLHRAEDRVPYADDHKDFDALVAFFSLPAKILDPDFEVPLRVQQMVSHDLELIEAHQGYAFSAIVDSGEDFSQYVPRGHYTRNEQFGRFFKAMSWYGRRMFRVHEARPEYLPPPCVSDHWSDEHMLAETRQMLLITWMLYNTKIDDKPAIETWNRLYVPTVLFAGQTEDLNPMQVRKLAEKVWGDLTRSQLANRKELRQFARLASELTNPKIDSSGAGRRGFSFLGQRFSPDSYVMQSLVTDADKPLGSEQMIHPLPYMGARNPRPFTWGFNLNMNPKERRFMPRGLDVMAAMGSAEALKILTEQGDAEYAGYPEILEYLQKEIGRTVTRGRHQNLYCARLHALRPALAPIESPHVPDCLKSLGWVRKQLASSLASWAQLRHDSILYVKQSYTPTARSAAAPPSKQEARGYVEPQAELYRRLAAMATRTQENLTSLDVMPAGLEKNYLRFADICSNLARIADKELAGQDLSEEDYQFIRQAAGAMKSVSKLPPRLSRKVQSGADRSMATVADVHTNNNSEKVLEEAVGTPFLLSVSASFAGKMTTLQGAVFSYYEFKQPMKDRLTDEAWQTMLADPDERPALPRWFPLSLSKQLAAED